MVARPFSATTAAIFTLTPTVVASAPPGSGCDGGGNQGGDDCVITLGTEADIKAAIEGMVTLAGTAIEGMSLVVKRVDDLVFSVSVEGTPTTAGTITFTLTPPSSPKFAHPSTAITGDDWALTENEVTIVWPTFGTITIEALPSVGTVTLANVTGGEFIRGQLGSTKRLTLDLTSPANVCGPANNEACAFLTTWNSQGQSNFSISSELSTWISDQLPAGVSLGPIVAAVPTRITFSVSGAPSNDANATNNLAGPAVGTIPSTSFVGATGANQYPVAAPVPTVTSASGAFNVGPSWTDGAADTVEVQVVFGDAAMTRLFNEKYDFALCRTTDGTACVTGTRGAPIMSRLIGGGGGEQSRVTTRVSGNGRYTLLFRPKSTSTTWGSATAAQRTGVSFGQGQTARGNTAITWGPENGFIHTVPLVTVDYGVSGFLENVLGVISEKCSSTEADEGLCTIGTETNSVINGISFAVDYRTLAGASGSASGNTVPFITDTLEGTNQFRMRGVAFGTERADRRFASIVVSGLTSEARWSNNKTDVSTLVGPSGTKGFASGGLTNTDQTNRRMVINLNGENATAASGSPPAIYAFPTHAGMNRIVADVMAHVIAKRGQPAVGGADNEVVDDVVLVGTAPADISAASFLGGTPAARNLVTQLLSATETNSGIDADVKLANLATTEGGGTRACRVSLTWPVNPAGNATATACFLERILRLQGTAENRPGTVDSTSLLVSAQGAIGTGPVRRIAWTSSAPSLIRVRGDSTVALNNRHFAGLVTRPASTVPASGAFVNLTARTRVEMFGLPEEGANVTALVPMRVTPRTAIVSDMPEVYSVSNEASVADVFENLKNVSFSSDSGSTFTASGEITVLRLEREYDPFLDDTVLVSSAIPQNIFDTLTFGAPGSSVSFDWRWRIDETEGGNHDDSGRVSGTTLFNVFDADNAFYIQINTQPKSLLPTIILPDDQNSIGKLEVGAELVKVGSGQDNAREIRYDWYIVRNNCVPTVDTYTNPTCAVRMPPETEQHDFEFEIPGNITAGEHQFFVAVSTTLDESLGSPADNPVPEIPVVLSRVVDVTVERQEFTPVTNMNLVGGTSFSVNGFRELTATVVPANANKRVVTEWQLVNAGTTAPGAEVRKFDGKFFVTATGAGAVVVRAVIADGGVDEDDFSRRFTLTATTTPVSIEEDDREVPVVDAPAEVVVVAPVAPRAALTAGPNPASRGEGRMNFFYEGPALASGTLRIFDASGNLVRTINVANGEIPAWDLADNRGRAAADGTYLVRGALVTVQGARVAVSTLVGITR